jgi:branched-chain amino acid transport system permease protein
MTYFLQQLINGLAEGSTYALIALGYTMVFGVLRLINFAHGDVFMVGAFVGVYATRFMQHARGVTDDYAAQPLWTVLISILGAMIVCGMLGFVIERFCYRPLRKSSRLSSLITAIGISLFLEYLLQIAWYAGGMRFFGSTPTAVARVTGFGGYEFRNSIGWVEHTTGLSVTGNQVFALIVTMICLAALFSLVQYTRTGKAMRAVSASFDSARLMGIDVNHIISLTFVAGSSLAAVGGVISSLAGSSIDPLMGIQPGLKAFIAAVIGGIGNLPGAALGGLLLGVVEAFVGVMGYTQYQDAAAFVILILMLLIRPEGIFGKATPEKV